MSVTRRFIENGKRYNRVVRKRKRDGKPGSPSGSQGGRTKRNRRNESEIVFSESAVKESRATEEETQHGGVDLNIFSRSG